MQLLEALSGFVWATVFALLTFLLWHLLVWLLLGAGMEGYGLLTVLPLFLAALATNVALPRQSDDGRFASVGASLDGRGARLLLRGLLLGSIVAGAVLAVQRLGGWMALVEAPPIAGEPGVWAPSLWEGVILLAIGAAGEELFLRGYGFQQLARALTPLGAAALTALLFGLLHGANPEFSQLSLVNTTLFGGLFGWALVRHRSLWLTFGMHYGWNLALAFVGAGVSGLRIQLTDLAMVPTGPPLLSGGRYGPEASVVALGGVLLAALAIGLAPILRDPHVLIWDAIRQREGTLPMRTLSLLMLGLCLAATAGADLDVRQRQELIRGLTAEYGTAKVLIPRSKKPLEVTPQGAYDQDEWSNAMNEFGPAARLGDMIQITRVDFKGRKLVLELNHGLDGGRKWWHRIQISGGSNRGSTLGQNAATHAPGGTEIALVFDEEIPLKTPEEFKQLLKPILDFEQRTATELYLEQIDPKFKEAIERNEVILGMDREMVLLAKDRPDNKLRDFKDGAETEDWIYGRPPGDIVFVTFENGKVTRVKHAHANLGGQVKELEPLDY